MLVDNIRIHLHIMDRNVYETDESFQREDNGEENETETATLFPLVSLNASNDLIWTPAIIFRLSVTSLLMLFTLLGNLTVITTVVSCAELRKNRVNVFIVNLAAGDLLVCFVSIPYSIVLEVMGQWVLGPVACKLLMYGYIVTVASTTFLLTAMSIDRYQVRCFNAYAGCL